MAHRCMLNHYATAVALVVGAIFSTASAAAEMYKWVDDRGVTIYSDKKPDDPKSSNQVKTIGGNLSVYSPDKALLQAVEVARVRANQPPAPEIDRTARYYAVPMNPQPPYENDPCAYGDCAGYYPVAAYPFRRHHSRFGPAVLPAGATAGTVNSPGIIPGNTGTQFGVPTRTTGSPALSATSRSGPLEPRFR